MTTPNQGLDGDKVKLDPDNANRILAMIASHDRISKLTDAQLSEESLDKGLFKLRFGSEEFDILDELIRRFDKLAGIVRHEDSGEIVSGGGWKS